MFSGYDELILQALREDIGTGDITTNSCVPADGISHGIFTAKADGIIAGLDVALRVFYLIDSGIRLNAHVSDGDRVNAGDTIAEISGSSRAILTGERTALNFLQNLSGIATATSKSVAQISGTKAKITDTRKTIPGMRTLAKYAVRCGGGSNHRFNLSDGVLIKDNHIKAAGGIQNAVAAARDASPHTLRIEVETETLDDVAEALRAGADIIMLDNMTASDMSQAVLMVNGRALLECSGNMGEGGLREAAETGVDFISIGALTHSPKALDISLKFV